ncbi:putative nuclease HARBI1 [Helicoverpa armigera]|uniref:putative nuclease HARBI1 n=1 Tax=Helicoverpa armigera TaxID=29058 RepID=UPI002112960F|nr:putative nuclease HARBI1 [Helicoverpa armigera]
MDIFDNIDDLAIEEETLINEYINPPERKERIIRPRPDHFRIWDSKEFHRRFRLRKESVQYLLSLIENKIKHQTERNQCISPMLQLLIALRFYATGSFYITVGDFGGIHSSTMCRIIKKVTEAIASLRTIFINLPRSDEDIRSTQLEFYKIARFPRVVSAIDGTHIRIQSPGGNTAEEFRNRKGFFSFNVQAMCSADLMFQDIVARWPGSTHDCMIFANSHVKYHFENGEFGNGIILGDSGYELTNYLLTPFQNPDTPTKTLYNESQIRTRNVIERCFGVWKRRFPVLSIGLRCRLPLAQDVIVACAVLHNLARSKNEEEPPVDPELHIPPQPIFPPAIADFTGDERCHTRNLILINYFHALPTE